MKVQDLAYKVCARTMELLEKEGHYKIPEHLRKQVSQKILEELDKFIE